MSFHLSKLFSFTANMVQLYLYGNINSSTKVTRLDESSEGENSGSGTSGQDDDLLGNMELLGVVIAGSVFFILAIYCCYRYRNDYEEELSRTRAATMKSRAMAKRTGSTTMNTDLESFNTDDVNYKIRTILKQEKRI